jgi:DNA-binding transcriptional LysR family regulator
VDIQQLKYFVNAVELRSVSDAAKAMSVTQPAVTKGLRKLEQELDAPLLERGPGGVRPTRFGRSFYAHARAVLKQLERGEAEILELRGDAPAELTIGTTPSFIDALLPRIIDEFGRAWPNVRLKIVKGLSPALIAQTRDGELDAVFMLLGRRDAPGGLVYEALGDVEIVFVARNDHPLARRTEVSATQLAAARWLLLDSPDVHGFFESLFRQVELAAPEPSVLTNSMRLIRSAVAQTDYIGFLPRHMVAAELRSGLLTELTTELDAGAVDAGILMRPGALRSVVQAFVEMVREMTAGGNVNPAAPDSLRRDPAAPTTLAAVSPGA